MGVHTHTLAHAPPPTFIIRISDFSTIFKNPLTKMLPKCNNIVMAKKQTQLAPLDFVKLAVSQDTFRPLLNSVLHEDDTLVATDTHRLHIATRVSTTENKTMLHVGKNCDLKGDPNNYPNWRRVVPEQNALKLSVTGSEFQFFCTQIRQFLKTDKGFIDRAVFVWDVEKNVLTVNAEKGNVKASFEYTGEFKFEFLEPFEEVKKFKVGVNINYLIDALQVSKYDVTILFGNMENIKDYSGEVLFHQCKRPLTISNYEDTLKAVVMIMDLY